MIAPPQMISLFLTFVRLTRSLRHRFVNEKKPDISRCRARYSYWMIFLGRVTVRLCLTTNGALGVKRPLRCERFANLLTQFVQAVPFSTDTVDTLGLRRPVNAPGKREGRLGPDVFP